ncbi:hypothetical protein HKK72_10430 [Actinomadura sp. HBU206391]|nr:hypothetical protein [Actinomadura sp. HBU206391]
MACVPADERGTAGYAGTARDADDLIAGLTAEPWGQVSPSVYETGRLVTLTPWLAGHVRRVEYLVATQRPDGAWGGPDGYALVPTLSATEAILTTLRCGTSDVVMGAHHAELTGAAVRGIRVLRQRLGEARVSTLPDMPAIELIVPSLVASVNRHLDSLGDTPVSGLEGLHGTGRLRLPAGMREAPLAAIRARLGSGATVPQKLMHAIEVVGGDARRVRTIRPEVTGTVGASPAATAAWLGEAPPASDDPARRYLEAVVGRYGGPVPCGIPITVFERAWVIGWLVRGGGRPSVPAELVESLAAAIEPVGASAAAGLPPDADTTAGALYALSLLGVPRKPDVLWAYETDTHFCTWHGEDGLSVSTNAHVLEAFGQSLSTGAGRLGSASRYAATVAKVASWLREMQESDGSWLDRWHASPYYATACCALALDHFDRARSELAVRQAVRWVLATQRTDGSWGRWVGTAEETAYAMHVLLLARVARDEAWKTAVARGRAVLLRPAGKSEDPPLWHDKDLYLPTAIVRAAVIAALHLAAEVPEMRVQDSESP